MSQKKQDHKGNKLLTARQLDEKLKEIIEPLLQNFPVALDQQQSEKAFELFAMAVLQGVELSELNDERLDGIFKEQIDKAEKKEFENYIMGGGANKAKNTAAIMSASPAGKTKDGLPRFATPDEFDPKTGKYIGKTKK
jgi:hypothetical protein